MTVQLISQTETKRSFRPFSGLRHPNHFLLAGVRHCLELKRHHNPTIPRGLCCLNKSRFYPGKPTPYRKIPKISHGAYIFQRSFFRGLLLEELIFGGTYLRREICVSKSIGLALKLGGNAPFLLCFTLYLRAISKYKSPGAYIWRGNLGGL